MTHELQPVESAALPALDAAIVAYVEASKASNTRKAYASDWTHFEQWCKARGEPFLPAFPQTVAAYITALADTHKPATLQRRLASISVAHQAAGYPSPAGAPLVRATMQGIRRTHGVAQRQAAPLLVEQVRQAVCISGDTARDVRDKAIILLGLAGAFRRSELVALDVSDLQFREQGVVVTLRRSKTNQEGQDESKDIGYGAHEHTCPVRALRRWLEVAGIESGPVFRPFTPDGRAVAAQRLSDRAVSRAVKAAAKRIGLSADLFSGHSLRAGFVTQGYRAGIPEADIMRQSGHKSRAVLGKYRREGERFLTNFSAKVGL
ncbi:MAG: site-specific integrase [Candidatus Hydrogenedentes bacterium]|nr:site-specific integrase [Candidatus Hydrogenedentota bacterium]